MKVNRYKTVIVHLSQEELKAVVFAHLTKTFPEVKKMKVADFDFALGDGSVTFEQVEGE